MKAIKINLKSFKMEYVSTNKPEIQCSTDVIVKIAFGGICGTDLHIMQGEFPATDNVIMGHEMCGTVSEIPDSCKSLAIGDRVIINPNSYCGSCLRCRKGLPNLCEIGGFHSIMGIFGNGGWAEYCKAHIQSVHKIPDTLSLQQGVLCEPISCIVNGLDKISPIDIGSNILIIGAGIIGILWCCILHLEGHRNVFVSEPNANRRNIVNKLNLGFVCLDWIDILKTFKSGNIEADICVDCSGNAKAMEEAVDVLAPGAKMSIFGVSSPNMFIRISPFEMYKRELTVMGNIINTTQSVHKALSIMESLGTRYLDYEKLGIKTYRLDEYAQALDDLKSGTLSKAVFKLY